MFVENIWIIQLKYVSYTKSDTSAEGTPRYWQFAYLTLHLIHAINATQRGNFYVELFSNVAYLQQSSLLFAHQLWSQSSLRFHCYASRNFSYSDLVASFLDNRNICFMLLVGIIVACNFMPVKTS